MQNSQSDTKTDSKNDSRRDTLGYHFAFLANDISYLRS